jgi:hypothetical protein
MAGVCGREKLLLIWPEVKEKEEETMIPQFSLRTHSQWPKDLPLGSTS